MGAAKLPRPTDELLQRTEYGAAYSMTSGVHIVNFNVQIGDCNDLEDVQSV